MLRMNIFTQKRRYGHFLKVDYHTQSPDSPPKYSCIQNLIMFSIFIILFIINMFCTTVERDVKGQFSSISFPILINMVFYFPFFASMNGQLWCLKECIRNLCLNMF